MDPIAYVTIALFLAAILMAGAVKKLLGMEAFLAAAGNYADFAPGAVRYLLPLVPLVEFGIGVALLLPSTAANGSLAAGVLFVGYAGLLTLSLWRGREAADCGCSFGGRPVPLQPALVWRSLLLAGAAFGLMVSSGGGVVLGLSGYALALLGALGLFISYLAVEAFMALPKPRKGLAQ